MTSALLLTLWCSLAGAAPAEPDLVGAPATKVAEVAPAEAVQAIALWLGDPVQFVRDNFGAEPDEWQADALRAYVVNPRLALKAAKGPGKSTVLAWCGWWGIGLHPHSNQFALSITLKNLQDGLWKELAVWYGKCAWLQREFELSAERIYHRAHPKTWWISARSFPADARPDQQANTLAGLHAPYVAILCDESSDYPNGVMPAAEGIFTTVGAEAHLVQAGNATRSEGPLFDACTKDRHRWVVIEVTGDPDDPKRSPRVSMEAAREAIASWGRDNPWVMVNFLGLFPPVGSDRLVGPNDITAAEKRNVTAAAYTGEPIIWGLDVARFGEDKSHLRKRQGPVLFRGYDFRGLDGPTLAARVSLILERAAEKDRRRPDAVFVDLTGVGASGYDHLKLLGWGDVVVGVDFGASPDEERFADKRAEMWWRAAQWVRKQGCLPSGSNVLGSDLCAPKFDFKLRGRRTCFVLESKADLAKRGLSSPDEGDAFALTFASTSVVRRDYQKMLQDAQGRGGAVPSHDYDPYADGRA